MNSTRENLDYFEGNEANNLAWLNQLVDKGSPK